MRHAALLLLAIPLQAAAAPRAVELNLRELNTAGYAILPAGALMDAPTERRVLEMAARLREERLGPAGSGHFDLPAPDHLEPVGGELLVSQPGLKAFADRLGENLEKATSGRLVLIQAMLRSYFDYAEITEASDPHLDRDGFLTATYSFRGPGTLLYPIERDKVREVQALERQTAVLSAKEREYWTAGEIPATVHSIPPGRQPERVLLLLRYAPPELPQLRPEPRLVRRQRRRLLRVASR